MVLANENFTTLFTLGKNWLKLLVTMLVSREVLNTSHSPCNSPDLPLTSIFSSSILLFDIQTFD